MTSTISSVGSLHGLKIIQNSAYPNRVAELDARGSIVGHSYNGGKNQQWNFKNIGPNLYNISTSFGPEHVVRSEPVESLLIIVDAIVTVRPVVDGYRISIKDRDGRHLYWTLNSGKEFANIDLESVDDSGTQFWNIRDCTK